MVNCKLATLAAFAVVFFTASANAQDFVNESHVGWLPILADPDVQTEIGLNEAQASALLETMREELRSYIRQRSGLSTSSERDAEDARYRATVNGILASRLVPFQIQRLHQLALWQRINQSGGLAGFLQSGDIQRNLGLSKDKAERVAARSKELEQDYQDEVSALRTRYREKLLDRLDPATRARIKERMGRGSRLGEPVLRF